MYFHSRDGAGNLFFILYVYSRLHILQRETNQRRSIIRITTHHKGSR